MSRTLFWYIFRDLLRIFVLASGALSAIMSFGGLLRPLYEFGLDVSQVSQILAYSGPAMTAYSLPIAALFATTIVYGRFGADNEITACRAAGISFLAMSMPAFVLGLFTAFISLGLLSFLVPASTLKVERIIYSNLAKLVAGEIDRSHQLHFDQSGGSKPLTVFAHSAQVLPTDPTHPHDQAVRLFAPLIVNYEPQEHNRPLIPRDFYLAREATAFIRQDYEDDDVAFSAALSHCITFPRVTGGTGGTQNNVQLSEDHQDFGPIFMPSPVRENTKFMDILRLRAMLNFPEQSRRIRGVLNDFVRRDQQEDYLQLMVDMLNAPGKSVDLNSGGESYKLVCGSVPATMEKDHLVLAATTQPGSMQPRLVQTMGNQSLIDVSANQINIEAIPDSDNRQIALSMRMLDAIVTVDKEHSPRANFARTLTVGMPSSIFALTTRPASDYVSGLTSPTDKMRLDRELFKLGNSIISELNARASFAISCLILVMVGCALGMMFRSGNFLSAFAVSVVPALLSIALIVTGQHTCENIPWEIPAGWTNPLNLGLILIWAGNLANLAIASMLLWRLQIQ